jgi:hypothetical protein
MEAITGNVFAFILIAIIIYSVFRSMFVLVFRDGRGLGLYGGRGEFYMSD